MSWEIHNKRFKTEPSEDAGSDNTVRETANYLGALPGVPHQSYNEEYFFVTFKIVLQNCI
jgi:hypothetical protein